MRNWNLDKFFTKENVFAQNTLGKSIQKKIEQLKKDLDQVNKEIDVLKKNIDAIDEKDGRTQKFTKNNNNSAPKLFESKEHSENNLKVPNIELHENKENINNLSSTKKVIVHPNLKRETTLCEQQQQQTNLKECQELNHNNNKEEEKQEKQQQEKYNLKNNQEEYYHEKQYKINLEHQQQHFHYGDQREEKHKIYENHLDFVDNPNRTVINYWNKKSPMKVKEHTTNTRYDPNSLQVSKTDVQLIKNVSNKIFTDKNMTPNRSPTTPKKTQNQIMTDGHNVSILSNYSVISNKYNNLFTNKSNLRQATPIVLHRQQTTLCNKKKREEREERVRLNRQKLAEERELHYRSIITTNNQKKHAPTVVLSKLLKLKRKSRSATRCNIKENSDDEYEPIHRGNIVRTIKLPKFQPDLNDDELEKMLTYLPKATWTSSVYLKKHVQQTITNFPLNNRTYMSNLKPLTNDDFRRAFPRTHTTCSRRRSSAVWHHQTMKNHLY
ncbi:hypothetical protein SNEBB_010561 [Seison nebaliae]|nr:hypothetical protein SNEBB_010561 [Seison nebaliae]